MRSKFSALIVGFFSFLCSPLLAGSLQVNLTPLDAVTAGAQWRIDSGAWQASGATVSGLAAGSHTIDYDTVAGYTSPATETVSLAEGDQLSLSRSYSVTSGLPSQLTLSLTPTNGNWRIDGGPWQASGATVSGLLSGPHTIAYYAFSGYAAPPTETVTLVAGANSLSRSYTQLAKLTVSLTPTNGNWRIDGGPWRTNGATVTNLTLGSHTIEYYTLSGYTAPPTETVTLVAGANSLSRSYTQLAKLTVSLTPATGLWRIDGGAWRSSGASATNLTPGEHTLQYSTLSGYTTPPSETLTLPAGTTSIQRSY